MIEAYINKMNVNFDFGSVIEIELPFCARQFGVSICGIVLLGFEKKAEINKLKIATQSNPIQNRIELHKKSKLELTKTRNCVQPTKLHAAMGTAVHATALDCAGIS